MEMLRSWRKLQRNRLTFSFRASLNWGERLRDRHLYFVFSFQALNHQKRAETTKTRTIRNRQKHQKSSRLPKSTMSNHKKTETTKNPQNIKELPGGTKNTDEPFHLFYHHVLCPMGPMKEKIAIPSLYLLYVQSATVQEVWRPPDFSFV